MTKLTAHWGNAHHGEWADGQRPLVTQSWIVNRPDVVPFWEPDYTRPPWEHPWAVDFDDLAVAFLADEAARMEQFRPRAGKQLEGARALVFAVLADGIASALRQRPSPERTEALTWLYEGGDEYVFSFDSCCEHLGLSPLALRLGVTHLAGTGKSVNLLATVRVKPRGRSVNPLTTVRTKSRACKRMT